MHEPLLLPAAGFETAPVRCTLDGKPVLVRSGQSVLAVLLLHGTQLRRHEISGEPRAGFCLMGACQDCWVWLGPNRRGRACTTEVADGMELSTAPTPDRIDA